MSERKTACVPSVRPLPAIAFLSLVLLLFPPGSAFSGYGYGEQEDPLLTGFTSVIAHGKEGNRVVSRDIQKVEGGEEWAARTGFRRIAVFPLGAIPGAAGFFGLGSRLPGEVPAEVVETLSAFVSQFTLSLGNVKLFSEVNELSLTDQLTGVANRRGLSLILRREMEVCSRYNLYLSLAMVDIDRFKKVNDTHGHAFGDTVLKKVAETLKANVRGPDFVARCGGEEFCVILPFTDEEMGRTMCERIRREIEKQVFTTAEGGALRVTASFGISSLRRDAANEEELLAHADAALYRAKERGRNRVELYRESATAAG